MNIPSPFEGRASLSRSYRNLSEREIRAKLDGVLGDAERVTAQAELLRRGAGNDAVDTALATGFAPTSALEPEGTGGPGATNGEPAAPGRGRSRLWWRVGVVLVLAALALAWALRSRLVHAAGA
jgi:hypothetical protein